MDLERQELGNRTVVKRAQGREWRHRETNSCYKSTLYCTTKTVLNKAVSVPASAEEIQDYIVFVLII